MDSDKTSGDWNTIRAVTNHIEKYVGSVASVMHEIESVKVHLDVHWVKPTTDKPFHTLVTSGMSDLPMSTPIGLFEHNFCELYILLPADWPLVNMKEDGSYVLNGDPDVFWPLRELKTLAVYPHLQNNWVGYGHTICIQKDRTTYSSNCNFTGMLLLPSLIHGAGFNELHIHESKTINFYNLIPLYKEEMDFKVKFGVEMLMDRFIKFQIPLVIDIKRKNTCM